MKNIYVRDMNMCIQTKTSGKGSNKVHKTIIINLDLNNEMIDSLDVVN